MSQDRNQRADVLHLKGSSAGSSRSYVGSNSSRKRTASSNEVVADLTLDKTMLQDAAKKMVKPGKGARRWRTWCSATARVSVEPVVYCGTAGRRRGTRPKHATRVRCGFACRIWRCRGPVFTGYRRLHVLLRREGWPVNVKRVWRHYKAAELNLRRKVGRKKRASQVPRGASGLHALRRAVVYADFVTDELVSGQRFRALTVVDIFSRSSELLNPPFPTGNGSGGPGPGGAGARLSGGDSGGQRRRILLQGDGCGRIGMA